MATYFSKAYNFGGYKEYRAALELTKSSTAGNAKTTINWVIRVQMKYGSLWGVGIKGTNEISGHSGTGYLSSSPGSTWTTVKTVSGTKTYTGSTSSQSKTFGATAYGTTVNGYGSAGGSISVSHTETIPALLSYTITYNANGGSGAPSKQTKYYGKDLKISTTKPTRSGYTFKGWALSSGGSVYYTPGSTCGQNKSLTLYAVWKAITYTVSYNGNTPSGAGTPTSIPSSQTKTYGKTLTLSKTEPKLTNYSFLGWATSASGSIKYQPGGSYTSNSAVTLYAKWEKVSYDITFNKNTTDTVNNFPSNVTDRTSNYSFNTTPTRSKYIFVGWGTSATSTSPTYKVGDTYTKKTNITLYAIWKVNYYTISYNKTLPSDSSWANESQIPGTTSYDKTSNPTYTINNGAAFKLNKVEIEGSGTSVYAYVITSFKGSDGKTYKLSQTITPTVGTSLTLTPVWAEQSVGIPVQLSDIEKQRVNIDGDPSRGGKNVAVNFMVYPTGTISAATGDITYNSTVFKVQYSKNGSTWTTDVNKNITEPDVYNKILNNFDENYKYWKITYGNQVLSSEIEIPSRYQENDDGTETPFESIEPSITHFNANRLHYTREEVVISFDWTCYYDGHENYNYRTSFSGIVRPYEITEDDKEYLADITVITTVHGNSGSYSKDEPLEELIKVPVNCEAEFILTEIICYTDNEEAFYKYEIPEANQLVGTVESGGFPLHISSDGESVAFFGTAKPGVNELFINSPATINGLLKINGDTIINNTLNISKTLKVDGLATFNNGLNITGQVSFNNFSTTPVSKITGYYPIGSIICMSTNTNPTAYYGGTWKLVDKKLKSQWISSGFFTWDNTNTKDASTTSSRSSVAILNGNTIELRIRWYNKVAMSDSAIVIGTIDFSKIGLSTKHDQYTVGWADGLNAVPLLYLGSTSGKVYIYDWVTRAVDYGSTTGASIWANWIINERYTSFIDSFCDKFYFQRTA